MKKVLSLIIAIMALSCVFTSALAADGGDFYFMLAQINNNKLFVNAGSVDFDEENPEVVPVLSEEGNALIPLRTVVTVAGGKVDWDEATRSVIIKYNDKDISFALESSEIAVGEEKIELSKAPYSVHGRTLVPLDFFSNCMKGSAEFDKDTNTAMLGFETTSYAE